MPVVNKLRELHLGKDLADLESLFNVDTVIKGRKTEHLCSTAKKLLDLAVHEQKRGDEEASYVNYMKYLSVVTAVQKVGGKDLTPSLMEIVGGKKSVMEALDKAEVLKASLRFRYKLISDQATVDAALLEQEHDEAEAEVKKRAQTHDQGLSNGLVLSGDGVSLSCKRLYEIQNSKKLRVLILDARPAVCFANSHMTYENCISIPEEMVEAGVSAAALERNMPAESRALFSQRRLFDQVVMLDWNSTEAKFTPGSKLHILQSILLRWDPEVIYKHPPLILKGGYEDWLITYPTLTTNPTAKQASHDILDDLLLDDIEYPSFDSDLSIKSMGLPDSRPGVDRGSKAAAIQTYDERSRTVTELLEASVVGVDASLLLEKKRLLAEQEWETLRVSKEKEADDELRQLLQDRQEELMSNILKLEESQRKKEAENQLLRKQLEEMKRRESRDSANSAPIPDRSTKMRDRDADIKKKIEFKKAETIVVAKQREDATNERLRRVEFERSKRKQEEAESRKAKQLEQQRIEDSYTIKLNDNYSSTMMKRSHSSPNIAQLSDGEDVASKGKVPEYNRMSKPLSALAKRSELYAARKRDFSHVYGTPGRGLTGLKNLGNSCYMNSIIQCINNTNPIMQYFCKGDHRTEINHDSETRGEIALEMAAVIRALWSNYYRSIACRDLKETVGQHKREFLGTQQQDSHEFLFYLIDWLHNDLNKRNSKTKLPPEEMREDLTEAQKQWNEFERCNLSIFQKLFFGQQKSTVQCLRCGNESVTYETFNHLTLPLPSNVTRCALSDCMKLYLSGDRISGWKCTKCKELRDATKKFDICKLPPILVIHFKRFQHDGWSSKIQTYVDFPLDNVDMGTYGVAVPKQQHLYNLYGVSNHYGTIEGGHYTAYCKNCVLKSWYKFDDQEVSELLPSEVKTGAAYILFYSSVPNDLLPNDNKTPFPIGR